ncbi:ATP-binding protein [Hallella bergensis]|uniref:ATP-binding protein n=1 Tax=Hallella bergensis TaxID=242750 RepID=UPI0039909DC8
MRTADGLSNGQVNDIYRDTRGYIWFGTQSGLNRYDGFRFKVFYFDSLNKHSLPNNCVDGIQEDGEGKLWVHTSSGYCIYDPLTEKFDADMEQYLSTFGITGQPDKVLIDSSKNLWVSVPGAGIFFVDVERKTSKLLEFSKPLRRHLVMSMACRNGRMVANFDNGHMVAVDVATGRPLWQSDYLASHHKKTNESLTTFIDKFDNYWVAANGLTSIYCSSENKWYLSANDFLTRRGYTLPFQSTLLLKDMADDGEQGLWIATDHLGLLHLDHATKQLNQYTYSRSIPTSVANNTIQSLLVDNAGALWVGCYKNGISYYSPSQSKFETLLIGDVCTITEDHSGLLWCGTNDKGIVVYNPKTGGQQTYDMSLTRLGSNVVVSSLTARDGSLWFGAFNGGLVHYREGQWMAYRADGKSGLLSDNVWSLCELPDGRIAVGTLGAGLQVLDPKTGAFINYTAEKNQLGSDYINSIVLGHDGRLIMGHSVNYSILDLKRGKVENFSSNRAGVPFLSTQVNQIFEDSRGIIWMATASGVNAYDAKTDQLATLDWQVGMTGTVACSVVEDRDHNMWLVSDHGVARVVVKKNNGQWEFFTISFNSLDGLQNRQFNYRSILLASNGSVVIGGQDGLNIIPPRKITHHRSKARVIFSGLVLFDHPLRVGEEYDGHTVLKRSLEESRELHLKYNENAFTVQLASSEVSIPEKSRFMYRLKGFSDKWYFTTEGQSNVTYTGIPPGHYTLEVRVVTRYGVISDEVSRLEITIAPPFYLSFWAILLYIVILALGVWYARRMIIRRQQTKFEMQQMQLEAERTRELNEMKLTFFTNVSHELRTPLTLIISPLTTMLNKETDPDKKRNLGLIHRNAMRLLDMVTQILDFRKMEKQKETLNLSTGDIVDYVRTIVETVSSLNGKKVDVSFNSARDSLLMNFDADKVRKMVDNILSNTLKFTPEGGKVDVSLLCCDGNGEDKDDEQIQIRIADTGIGISDEDKAHIFERFYQAHHAKDSSYGGTGVGLHLVHGLAKLHGGDVTVADNPGGGTVFTITLPVRHDEPSHHIPVAQPIEPGDALSGAGNETRTEATESDAASETSPLYEVLLVDDSQDFLAFMAEELGSRFKVRVATNGKEALDRISEHKPDIILSDVMMPEMDGNELCRRVKGNKETGNIPFVMLTARLAQEHRMEGMESGADDYVTKPFNLDLLYLRMENLIKWHRMSPDEKTGKVQAELKPMVITSLDEQLVKKATAYVDENISDTTITVETMAQHLGMSRVHLYKKMLSITGSTPSEFMRQIRMRRAEQLLRSSQFSVSEVAYKVGFNIPRYFSKYFKEMYGMNPSQYKKQSQDEE